VPELLDKTVLITGATGYIGARALEFFSTSFEKVLAFSRESGVHSGTVDSISGSLRSDNFWRDVLDRVDVIVHLGGNTSLRFAEENPDTSLNETLGPLYALSKACVALKKFPRVLFASTATVYGLTPKRPVSERYRVNPITIYDLHKYYAERYLSLAREHGWMESVCFRFSNVYGPSPKMSSSSDRGILSRFALDALNGDPIQVYGSGEVLRDYIFIDDLARALVIAASSNSYLPKVMNLSSGRSYSFAHLVKLVAKEVSIMNGAKAKINYIPWPDNIATIERRNYVSNISLIKKTLGWAPDVSLEEGVHQLLSSINDFA
jgi:UDP-glucose 4-epimerase